MSKFKSWIDAYKEICKIVDNTPMNSDFESNVVDAVEKFFEDNKDDINVKRAYKVFYNTNGAVNEARMSTPQRGSHMNESKIDNQVIIDVKRYIEDLLDANIESNLALSVLADVPSYAAFDREHDVVDNLPSEYSEYSQFERKLDSARQAYIDVLTQYLFINESQYYNPFD